MPSRCRRYRQPGALQKDNKDITLAARFVTFRSRTSVCAWPRSLRSDRGGDPAALPALEAMLKSDDLSIELAPLIKSQIAMLKKPAGKHGQHARRRRRRR